MNEIYIEAGHTESRVAVMEDGEIAEIHIERQNREKITGNIYKGIVENVLPGMQAAFVNIGLERNAFLYIKDAVSYGSAGSYDFKGGLSIGDVLKPGQELIVQVSKEPIGSKGARVTTHAAIPGRYIVMMPDVDYIGISRRIEDGSERDRLRSVISGIKPEGMGFIVRTEAEGKNESDFAGDIRYQTALWENIKYEAARAKAPKLIYKDPDLVYRAIRDLMNRDTVRIVINEKNVYKKAVEIIELLSPDKKGILELYEGNICMMDFYGISAGMEKALSRKVWLKSGGYIVIDQTEALTVIDVNTGKFTGSVSLENTVLLTNVEAAREIARQLRLRDIGGIIVVDFIDMASDTNRNTVTDVLKNEFKKDRTKTSVFGITQLGLLEMTRKKMGKRLSSIMQKTCPLCEGTGKVMDEDTIARKIERKLEAVFKETDVPAVLVEVSEDVERYLKQPDNDYIGRLESLYNKKIIIKGLGYLGQSDMKVRYLTGADDVQRALCPFEKGCRVGISASKQGHLNASGRFNDFEGRVLDIIYDEAGDGYKLVVDLANKPS